MYEWINCNGDLALVPLPNDFLIIFLAKQCSQADNSILSKVPNRSSLANQFIRLCPI